jgi:hypothetical protein
MASSSAAQLAKKLQSTATALPKAQQRAGNQAALAIKTSWISIAGGYGLKPTSTIGRRRWSVRYNQGKLGNVYIRFTGMVHLFTNPTKAHEITPRGFGGGRGRSRGKRALVINGSPRRSSNHPGTKGQNFWPACKRSAQTVAPQVYWKNVGTNLLKSQGFGR